MVPHQFPEGLVQDCNECIANSVELLQSLH